MSGQWAIVIRLTIKNNFMIKHLFKLIWNKKKQNFFLIIEMLISFLVIFAVFTLLVYFYQNYKKPIGFDYENVWAVKLFSSEKIKQSRFR